MKSGVVSQIVFVSPRVTPERRNLVAKTTSPVSLQLIFCPWGRRNQARNFGAAAATNEILYYLDEDVLPTSSEAITKCLIEFENPKIDWISGPYKSKPFVFGPDLIYNFLANTWARLGEERVPHFLAGNVLARRHAWTWPESFTTGGEELEIHFQLKSSGRCGLFTEDMAALHQPNKSWQDLLHRLQQHENCENRRQREPKYRKLSRWLCQLGNAFN